MTDLSYLAETQQVNMVRDITIMMRVCARPGWIIPDAKQFKINGRGIVAINTFIQHIMCSDEAK